MIVFPCLMYITFSEVALEHGILLGFIYILEQNSGETMTILVQRTCLFHSPAIVKHLIAPRGIP